jgi:quinol monooxygenase YgiN
VRLSTRGAGIVQAAGRKMAYISEMNLLYRTLPLLSLFGLALISGPALQRGVAQQPAPKSSGNIYVVTHVDVAGGANLAEPIKILQEFAADSRKDPGCVRFELVQQVDRLNHFSIFSVWRTREAFEAHTGAAYTKRFRDKIQPFLGSPFDERLHSLLP